MKPVFQTKFGGVEGNCLEAVFASICEVGLDEIPRFDKISLEGSVYDDDYWFRAYQIYFAERWKVQMIAVDIALGLVPIGYHEIYGPSPRGDFPHAVVGLDGVMVHDPHPSGAGLVRVDGYTIFAPFGAPLKAFLKPK